MLYDTHNKERLYSKMSLRVWSLKSRLAVISVR